MRIITLFPHFELRNKQKLQCEDIRCPKYCDNFRTSDVLKFNFVIQGSSSIAYLYQAKIQDSAVGTDEVSISTGNNDTGNQFRYDSTNNQYIFNLNTGSLSVGAWQLKATLDDGTSHTVVVSIKQ